MKSIRILSMVLGAVMLLSVGACKSKVDVKNGDSTTVIKTDPNAVDNAGSKVNEEAMQKAVEAALVAKPGMESVDVTSGGEGTIILSGTAATENEKGQAQVVAQNVAGVKKVTNNIMVKK